MSLINEPILENFESTYANLYSAYPITKGWLDWWSNELVAGMIFRCKKKMPQEIAATLRKDTNSMESMHSTYYRLAGRKNNLVFGLSCLLLYSINLSEEFEDIKYGRAIDYGDSERWTRILDKYGRKMKQIRKIQKKNDGRSPDLVRNLIPLMSKNSAVAHLSPLKPGRKKGSLNVNRDPITTYPSYAHKNNSCYLTALMEVFHACYELDPLIGMVIPEKSNNSIGILIKHYKKRSELWRGKDEGQLGKCLKKGLADVSKWLFERKNSNFCEGQFGNPCAAWDDIIKYSSTPAEIVTPEKSLFAFTIECITVCNSGHQKIDTKTRYFLVGFYSAFYLFLSYET